MWEWSGIVYRRTHKALKSKRYICRKNDVRPIFKLVDPDNIKLRKRMRLQRRRYVADDLNFV